MKNKVLAVLTLVFTSLAMVRGQGLTNNSFENWSQSINYLHLSVATVNIYDTAVSNEADGWTSTNSVTADSTFHHVTLCTQETTDTYVGASALKLKNDSLKAAIGGLVNINIVAAGFIVSGRFPIDLTSFATSAGSGSFNPLTLPGAGVPVAGRMGSIGGYLKYEPVGGDTAYVIALLRKGSTVVAQAVYTRAGTDASYTHFEVPFTYLNCLIPDTLVYAIASGNPYTYNNLINQQPTGLHAGTVLYADSVYVSDTTVSVAAVAPIVVDDSAHTTAGVPVSVPVSANDITCYSSPLTPTVTTQPLHGTATVSGDSIIYAPTPGFVGTDSFYYTSSVGGSTQSAPGTARMRVAGPNAIIEAAGDNITRVYPNPASSKLYITSGNTAITGVNLYDLLGNLVKAESFSGSTSIDLGSFNEGLYIIRFTGAEGKVLSTSRFTVVK
jgi:hypothetical protein